MLEHDRRRHLSPAFWSIAGILAVALHVGGVGLALVTWRSLLENKRPQSAIRGLVGRSPAVRSLPFIRSVVLALQGQRNTSPFGPGRSSIRRNVDCFIAWLLAEWPHRRLVC